MPRAYRAVKTLREKAKFHESVVKHPNANVRLAANYIAGAAMAAKKGNMSDFLVCISLAQSFAKDVDFNNPVENLR